jgi:hypothetical protein
MLTGNASRIVQLCRGYRLYGIPDLLFEGRSPFFVPHSDEHCGYHEYNTENAIEWLTVVREFDSCLAYPIALGIYNTL